MAMIRACSYTATIQAPIDPEEYSAILVTFQQDGENLIEKDETQVTFDEGNKIIVQLDQNETKLFTCRKKCFIQIRCYKEQYNAPGSSVWAIDVRPALDDVTLPVTPSA